MKNTCKIRSGVYRISSNIDDRVYIGSSKYVVQRFCHHRRDLRNGKHQNTNLQDFYNLHGISVLKFEMLECCHIPQLIEREQYYLDSYPNKFNISAFAGKTLGVEPSLEKRIKISNSLKNAGLKGVKKSEETKRNMRKPKSAEHTANIKKAQEAVHKKVYQYSLDGLFVAEHKSVKDAGETIGIDRRAVSSVCNKNGKQKTAGGFYWTFQKQHK